VLDAMQKANVITNDNKCVKIVAEKFIDKVNPRIEFKLVTID
jgi:Holliday junction resolvase RusA-like endonuclease